MESSTLVKALLSREGRRDPYPLYSQLHQLGTLSLLDAKRDGFDAVVHGYEKVDLVLRDPSFGVVDANDMDRGRLPWRDHAALRTLYGSIFFTNGADHARVRRIFAQAFHPRRVAALEPAIIRLIECALDRLAELGAGGAPVDFMAEFALRLPSDAIAELLGVPEKDRAWFPPRVLAIGAILEAGRGAWRHLAAADTAATELTAYFAELAARRRADPRDDLLSRLVQVEAEDGQLSEEELLGNLVTLFNAGFVTTTHLLGNGLTLLLSDAWAAATLRAEPDRASSFVNEILRFEPPVQFAVRLALADTEILGVPLAAGSRVLALMGAANRDPKRFPDPDRFEPMRPDNQPLSFGGGPHYCLGAALSRLEGNLALPTLLRRFPGLVVAETPGERTSLVLRGYDRLAVRVG